MSQSIETGAIIADDTRPEDVVALAASALDSSVHAGLEHTESNEARTHRYSMGVLIGLIGALLLVLAFLTRGTATFSLSGETEAVKLPSFTLPAMATVLVGALLCLAATAALFIRRVPSQVRLALNVLAGLGFVFGFLAWAAASGKQGLPFQLSTQFNGTLVYATPLIFGALCGVMGERAGVVNVSIEGQFLTAAFAAALVGTISQSIVVGILAGIVVGVAMGALLAMFSIKYLVDQVVLGVVLNLFASGLTGFLYSKIMSTNGAATNKPPVLTDVAIPGLSKIPFLYDPQMAIFSVAAVNTWAVIPFATLVFRAALLGVSADVIEAARLDGARPRQEIWYILIPQVRPTLYVLTVLCVVYGFRSFDFIYIMTSGGPGVATNTLAFLGYSLAFVQYNYGMGAAVSIVSVLLVIGLAFLYSRSVFREEKEI